MPTDDLPVIIPDAEPPPVLEPPPVPRYDRGFEGASTAQFAPEALAVLRRPVDPRTVEVKPNGIVYLPWVHVAARLNEAFGPGAWTIVPRDKATTMGNTVVYFGALYINGHFIREAAGECEYRVNNDQMSYASAYEGAISDCLVRCCKVLGIGWELWDPSWREPFLAAAVSRAFLADTRKWFFWRNDRPKPWQVEKAKVQSIPASDLPQDDPRVVAIRRNLAEGKPTPAMVVAAVNERKPSLEQMRAFLEIERVNPPTSEVGRGILGKLEKLVETEPTPEEIGELFDAPPAKRSSNGLISEKQHKALEAAIAEYAKAWGQDRKDVRAKLKNVMGKEMSVEHFPDLNPEQYDTILRFVKPRPKYEGDPK